MPIIPDSYVKRAASAGWVVRAVQGLLLAWLVMSFVVQINTGLADNGDYSRFMGTLTSGPLGMENWPAGGTPANHDRFFHYWLPFWRLDWPLKWAPTSVMFWWIPGALLNAAVFSSSILWLPIVGLPIKLGLVAVVGLLLVWIERRVPRHRLLLTIVLAGPLVLSLSTTDFVSLINSFYREAGTLLYLLLFLGSVMALNARRSTAHWWLCLAASLLLTFAKASNIYWPIIWVPVLIRRLPPRFSWGGRLVRGAAGAALIGVLVVVSQRLLADHTNAVTSYDSFFNSALLVSQHPADHLKRLGMPEALPCVGVASFVGTGQDCYARYLSRMTPANSLSVMLWEPMVVVNQLKFGLDNLGDQSFEWDGIYAASDPRANLAPTAEGPFDQRYWGVRSNGVLNLWSWLRFHLFPHGWPALTALALFASLALIAFRRGGPAQDLALVSLVAIAACIIDVQLQVVGEGGQELIRHLFLANLLFDLAGISAVGSVLCDRVTAATASASYSASLGGRDASVAAPMYGELANPPSQPGEAAGLPVVLDWPKPGSI